jgi:hypothetical protein
MQTNGGEGRIDHDLIDICLGVGLSIRSTAWVVGDSVDLVWHEWSVRTGLPTPKDPVQSTIRKRAKEIQRGWTPELRQLAEHGCTARPSSRTVEYRQRHRREIQKRYDANRKAKEQACHSDSTGEKGNQSPSPVIVQQMTLSFVSTACEAIECV